MYLLQRHLHRAKTLGFLYLLYEEGWEVVHSDRVVEGEVEHLPLLFLVTFEYEMN